MLTESQLYQHEWYLKNREKKLAQGREWAKKNRGKVVEIVQRWQRKQGGIYWSWAGMKQRCDQPSHNRYKYYGARGITYAPEWKTFKGFKKDMEATYQEGLTIDRIDNNGNYCKENCRWVTNAENAQNKGPYRKRIKTT